MADEVSEDEFREDMAGLVADVAVDAVSEGWVDEAPVVSGGTLTFHDPSGFLTLGSPPPVTFDGFKFAANMGLYAPLFHLAYLARRGDAVAVELLTTFQVTIGSVGGPDYWPMRSAEEGVRDGR